MASQSDSKSQTSVKLNAAPEHEIILARTPEELKQCIDVRIEVFHVEQKFPLETEVDEWDAGTDAAHFLLRLTPSLTPIGTIRAVRPPGKGYYKLTRLAILKEYRKYRLGASLVRFMHSWVVQDATARLESAAQTITSAPSTVTVVCHSQIYAKGFYAKFGYIAEGEEFDEDGDPHQKMVLQLPLGLATDSLRPSLSPPSASATNATGAPTTTA